MRRKFDFYDINILEERQVDKNGETQTIPRRLVITFLENINAAKLNELIEDITLSPNYKKIFNEKFKAKCLRPFKLTGHIDKDSKYIIHKTNVNERKGRGEKVNVKIGGGNKPKKPFHPLTSVPKNITAIGGKPNLLGPRSKLPMGLPIGPGGMMPVSGNPMMGNMTVDGGFPRNPMMMGKPMSGIPSNPMANSIGMNPLANNPLGMKPLGSNPMISNPLMGMPNPMSNPMSRPPQMSSSIPPPKRE